MINRSRIFVFLAPVSVLPPSVVALPFRGTGEGNQMVVNQVDRRFFPFEMREAKDDGHAGYGGLSMKDIEAAAVILWLKDAIVSTLAAMSVRSDLSRADRIRLRQMTSDADTTDKLVTRLIEAGRRRS